MKIAYLGYDVLYPCLPALEAAGCQVLEVFTCDTDDQFEFHEKVAAFAGDRNIPCRLRPITLEDIHRLKALGCQAIFCAAYFYKVPIDHSLPIVNVHPSLLPEGRGAWPIPSAILLELPRSGISLHKMEPQIDTGDVLIQEAFPIRETDNLQTLTEAACRIAPALCARVARDFAFYWNHAVPQTGGSFWPYPQKPDYTITPATPPAQTRRILRAFYGFDCYLQAAPGSEICVICGEFLPLEHTLPFGTATTDPAGRSGYAVTGGIVLTPARYLETP